MRIAELPPSAAEAASVRAVSSASSILQNLGNGLSQAMHGVASLRPPGAWMATTERGSPTALSMVRWFYGRFGRRASLALLTPIVAYFFATGGAVRRASLDYLRTLWAAPRARPALDQPPNWSHVFRHLHEFAENLLDRLIVWSGDAERIRIDEQGTEHLLELVRQRRGGILLGSHIGSYDMLRLLSRQNGIVVNVLMFTRHSARINAFFERLHPGLEMRLIHYEPGSLQAAFEMRAAIDRGEFVGMMGDRVWDSERERSVIVPFLGRRARFPLGPFLLQAALGCPLFLTACVRTGPGRYAASTQPFAPAGVVPRGERTRRAEDFARRYAASLEEWCVRAPYQWFNFFEFWHDESEATSRLVSQ
jgi:predicted LPLAT superfamily acyltransferase